MTFEEIQIGDTAEYSKKMTRKIVDTFAQISGDDNPLHVDREYGAKSRFGANIVHGMLASALICRVLGVQLPGEGTIHVSQSLKFIKPIYIGETVTARITVTEKNVENKRIKMKTIILNNDGEEATVGEAEVIP
jgi:acyl dehydratase